MKKILIVLALLLSSTAAIADEPVPATSSAPTVTLTAAQFQQLIAKAVAPVSPVAVVPVATTTTITSTPIISAAGILGMDWGTFGSMVVGLIFTILGLIQGGKYVAIAQRVKTVIGDVASASYNIAEKDFSDLSGEKKFAAAMGIAMQIFKDDHGVVVTPNIAGQLSTIWSAKAAEPKLPFPAIDPSNLAAAQAVADAAQAVMTKTATEIADAAAKS